MKTEEHKSDDDPTRSALAALGDELEQAISLQLVASSRNLAGGTSDPHRQGRRRGTLALATLALVVVAAAAVVFTATSGSGEQSVLSASPQTARTEAQATADQPADSSSGDPLASMSGEEFRSKIFLVATPFVGTNPVCEPSGPSGTSSGDGSNIGAFTCTLDRAPSGMRSAANGGLPSTQMYIGYYPDRTSIIETRCESDAARLVWNCSSVSKEGEWLARDGVEGFTWMTDPAD
ncbi:MAG: hypothetical protein WBF71_08530 [Microthrixaceae bacterium]